MRNDLGFSCFFCTDLERDVSLFLEGEVSFFSVGFTAAFLRVVAFFTLFDFDLVSFFVFEGDLFSGDFEGDLFAGDFEGDLAFDLASDALATDALATEALATEALATDALATDALATDALATEALATEA